MHDRKGEKRKGGKQWQKMRKEIKAERKRIEE